MAERTEKKLSRTDLLLAKVRESGSQLTRRELVELTVLLALPAMLANLSSIAMEYIDASMVGHLGASPSASIGLVATTTWLFWGLGSALSAGFSVQVAHKIGANDSAAARRILRQALLVGLALSVLAGLVGMAISGRLPYWLGGTSEIAPAATRYFFIFSLTMPFFVLNFLQSSMLRCSGNVKIPSLLNVGLCVLDVVFNFFLIFPTRQVDWLGARFVVPGAGLGVTGAALGTLLAEFCTFVPMFYFLCFRSIHLGIFGRRKREENGWRSFVPTRQVLKRAFTIGMPVGLERIIMCGAQICSTRIVAPLGTYAIAANSFGINAESLCYMPGFGVSDAATTLVGQSVGAKREDLARRFAKITVALGVLIMTVMGALMYVAAPLMMGIMTPVPEIIELGTSALRIEAFAEPLFAAAIVCYGVMVGAGDTLIPSCINFGTIWAVRITLALLLSPVMGLNGVWLAMCIELCVRGLLLLARLVSGRWIPKNIRTSKIIKQKG